MEKMKTISIKGKPYVMVNTRLKAFRENFKGYALTSEIVHLTEDTCIIKATISDPQGRVLATGHAMEVKGSSNINATSHVENCESSAWGRALGNYGIGIDDSICSAEELIMAIGQRETPEQIAERKLNGEEVQLPTGEEFAKAMKSVKKATKTQVKEIEKIAGEIHQPTDRICGRYKVETLDALSHAQADEVLKKLKEAQK